MKVVLSISLLVALASWAGEPALFVPLEPSAPFAQLVALATRPQQADERKKYDAIRCEALALLAQQTKGPANREKTIKDALLAALSSDQVQVRSAGAAALARRGHRAESVALFSRLDADPEPLAHFYRALESPQKDPPLPLLRQGLLSPNPKARAAIAEVAGLCRVKAMIGDLERCMDADTDPEVHDQVSVALARLGARDSSDALLRLRKRGYQSLSLARAMIELGGEEEIRVLVPMLWNDDPAVRTLVAECLVKISPRDREAAIDALLLKLRDSSPKVRIASAQALARFRAPQAIPILRETLPAVRDFSAEERTALVSAVADFGEELALPLLNEMLQWRFREECGLETVLAGFGHPSSGVVAWKAYADDLNYVILKGYLVGEYRKALPVVTACADAELLATIRETAAVVPKAEIKKRLEDVAAKIAERLAQAAAAQLPPPRTLPPVPFTLGLRDSDDDGVPDLRDKYPNDNRRVEDIPVHYITFPERRFAIVRLREFAPEAAEPQFLTIDDDSRVGYLTEETVDGVPAFRVVSTDGFRQRQEWTLPDPGTLPGIEKLVPSDLHGGGTLIGTALWKPEAGAAPAKDSRLPPGSGFIFRDGKLTLATAAPFTADTLRSTHKKIDPQGRIFGHREERTSRAPDAPIRTVAFYGDHVFRDVPPFEVTVFSSNGCLLGYRDIPGGRESFIWDGKRFLPIRDEAHTSPGFRESIRPIAMNAKLQVIGKLEQGGRILATFLWEKGTMTFLTALIPQEYSMLMQNIEPLFINDAGRITFTAHLVTDHSKPPRPQTFDLTPRPCAESLLERLRAVE